MELDGLDRSTDGVVGDVGRLFAMTLEGSHSRFDNGGHDVPKVA